MSEKSGPKRSFAEEFKREAVRLAVERRNVSAVARDLGIHESVLNRWKCQIQHETEQPGSGNRPFLGKGNVRDEELTKLQRENARLKEEVVILPRFCVQEVKLPVASAQVDCSAPRTAQD